MTAVGRAVRVVAVALIPVVVVVIAVFATRAVLRTDARPAPPRGVTAQPTTGQVAIRWSAVDHVRGYLVSRDGAVVYEGPGTSAVDRTADAGRHVYEVRTVDDTGRLSDSAGATTTTGAGWGRYGSLVALLPDLLPLAPDARGYRQMSCAVRYNPPAPERGDAPAGSGQVWEKLRLACETGDAARDSVFVDFWDSAAVRDRAFAGFSAGGATMIWNHGTGFTITTGGRSDLTLRFSDRRLALVTIEVTAAGSRSVDQLVSLANALPI
ncbi:hypothetical protein [Williamsia sterculiae]|uniref:Fibronectin type-III domain-containing protein n=1 Tax=Williamsia sterculiae TaxID=1344003 RepID=A0A1N7GWX1_9NOCA|nr:hypothetical protein [Williamsia sterculiae]SIS17095.1 hypothetical protein SAMN05445060_3205 [Williamsia sterculiae]